MQLVDQHRPGLGNLQREDVLMEQLPQVKFIARRIHARLPQHIDVQDLIHAGILGLLDALKKYDETRHVQFKSYAQFRIRGAILDHLRELDWSPRELRKQARRIEDARSNLTARLGRCAAEEELAGELELSLNEFHALTRQLSGLDLISIQAESREGFYGENQNRYQGLDVPDLSRDSPYELCVKSEMERIIRNVLTELPRREGQMLVLYYFEELTMKQIGALLGVVESRVSQMHAAVILRLRSRLGGVWQQRDKPVRYRPPLGQEPSAQLSQQIA